MLSPTDLIRPLPQGWTLLAGMDSGTYMSGGLILFPPDVPDAFVVYEQPNYRYVGGTIELLGESVPEWARAFVAEYKKYVPHVSAVPVWGDENSQFKTELAHYGIHWRPNNRKLELRVEIAREYVQNRRVWLAPWLSILPYELEHAVWPDATSSAGRFERLKEHDHTLDWFEHILSRRPKHLSMLPDHKESFLEQHLRQHKVMDVQPGDPHLGTR